MFTGAQVLMSVNICWFNLIIFIDSTYLYYKKYEYVRDFKMIEDKD